MFSGLNLVGKIMIGGVAYLALKGKRKGAVGAAKADTVAPAAWVQEVEARAQHEAKKTLYYARREGIMSWDEALDEALDRYEEAGGSSESFPTELAQYVDKREGDPWVEANIFMWEKRRDGLSWESAAKEAWYKYQSLGGEDPAAKDKLKREAARQRVAAQFYSEMNDLKPDYEEGSDRTLLIAVGRERSAIKSAMEAYKDTLNLDAKHELSAAASAMNAYQESAGELPAVIDLIQGYMGLPRTGKIDSRTIEMTHRLLAV